MEKKIRLLRQFSSFKIVLVYAVVSAVYIFTSDYFLEVFIADIDLISKLQTVKGLIFIIITSLLLHVLMKRNINKLSNYYRQIIEFKLDSEQRSKQSKQEYINLFNHSPIPMWIFDVDSLRFMNVNEAACIHYGYTINEFLSMTIKEIRPKDDIPNLEEVLIQTRQSESYSIPELIRHRKKKRRNHTGKTENFSSYF